MSKTELIPSPQKKMLADVVSISRQFLRSVRLDTDYGREDALTGYICQSAALTLLENMASQILETRQRAFTWTGPYGGGKSSLALLLCTLVGSNKALRSNAEKILNLDDQNNIRTAFKSGNDGWVVIPVVGKRASIAAELASALAQAKGQTTSRRKSLNIVADIVATAEANPNGVLLVIDELGKFLESAALDNEDIYILQELAEAASRCNGKLVIVGILHQSFEAYSSRLGRQSQDDWAKIQGRFIDIPLASAADETIELIGSAIQSDVSPALQQEILKRAEAVGQAIKARRPATPEGIGLSLARCWPLHPITAALLGPISRRKFGQNERSTFGFLASREPLGFLEYLEGTQIGPNCSYGPARYWDYLKANLEPAIIASSDSHRWATACDAVERAEAKGERLHVELTKAVALIDMFRAGSGIAPEDKIIALAAPDTTKADIQSAISDLVLWRILVERKHLSAYGIYAGSDFDIEAAVSKARFEIGTYALDQISALTDLQPVLAKRLYQETGSMRWFSRHILRLSEASEFMKSFHNERGSVGAFFLCIPELGQNSKSSDSAARQASATYCEQAALFGVPANSEKIAELSLELAASERVFNTYPELEGDAVAKRELTGRIASVKSSLEEELSDAYDLSRWYFSGELQHKERHKSLSSLASSIAQEIYHKSPKILSELINREQLSSNSMKARKDLLYRMIRHTSEPKLGYLTHPADAGLYFTVLHACGIHAERDKCWGFGKPSQTPKGDSIAPLWWETDRLLIDSKQAVTLSDVYRVWAKAPFGLRAGIMPVLALAYIMANRSSIAMYIDGVFTPDISEATIDEWIQDPSRVKFKFVELSREKEKLLSAITETADSSFAGKDLGETKPLDAARALVSMVTQLPGWTRRTLSISSLAQQVRSMLLKASDPHKVLFADLPTLLETDNADELISKLQIITAELKLAYPKMLEHVRENLLLALDHQSKSIQYLNKRAAGIKGITGDFLLDAFATRLETFDGSTDSIEKIVSLATNKPPAQWVDRDIDLALSQIGSWSLDFRKEEAMAPLHGRPANRRILGVVFGADQGRDITGSIDISEDDIHKVESIANQIFVAMGDHDKDLALAALAEAGARLLSIKLKGEFND